MSQRQGGPHTVRTFFGIDFDAKLQSIFVQFQQSGSREVFCKHFFATVHVAAVGEYSPETNDFAHMTYDPRFAVFVDTSVAVQPLRHSLRFNLPSANPQLIDFPGPPQVHSSALAFFTSLKSFFALNLRRDSRLGPHDRYAACTVWTLRQASGMGSRAKLTNTSRR
jgi:hypothetical protein